MAKVSFSGNILLLGHGGVGRCTLPLLLKHLAIKPEQLTVMDMADCTKNLSPYLKLGINFLNEKLKRETFHEQLLGIVKAGDMIIDLAWNIDCCEILQWCHDHGVLYINTSVELWDPYQNKESTQPTHRTLYVRHMAIRKMIAGWKDKGATAVLEHGANPGLVSHFTKMALTDIVAALLKKSPKDPRRRSLEQAVATRDFPYVSHLLGVRVIHISEIDTQKTGLKPDPNVFDNTWSVEGLYEEGTSPAEMGWGTHEQSLPHHCCQHADGPKNQICLEQFGINTFVKTRVPSGEIAGMVVRHGEAFTLSDYLTVRSDDGKAVYRPTVHYAYCPCEAAVQSLKVLRMRDYVMQDKWRILEDDILPGGRDELGVLLMGHDFRSWWTGSILSIDETRTLVPHQNATTLQVAASILGAVCWMIRNPSSGVLIPDQLPHEEIMSVATQYLGDVVSTPIDWTPTGHTMTEQTWQFSSFLIPKGTSAVLEEAHAQEKARSASVKGDIKLPVPVRVRKKKQM